MATLSVQYDHDISLDDKVIGRSGEMTVALTVSLDASLITLATGKYCYLEFLLPDGTSEYKGSYDGSSGTISAVLGVNDNILKNDGDVYIQLLVRDVESLTAIEVWRSDICKAKVNSSINATVEASNYVVPTLTMPSTYAASKVTVEDDGGYYTSGNVEGALQELANALVTAENMDGTAVPGDVVVGATFYNTDTITKRTGTLALTGDAAVGNVMSGKTFYKDDPKTQLTGTLALTGNATASDVLATKTYYKDDPTSIQTGSMTNVGAQTIVPILTGVAITQGYHNGSGGVPADADFIDINIRNGVTIWGVTGNYETALTGDADVSNVLTGKTFYSDDSTSKLTGTMSDNGSVSTDISSKATEVTIQQGYHDGTGVVKISDTEQLKVVSGNIRSGITLLGVAGDANVVNTASGTAVAGEILATKKAWVDGTELTGSMTNNGANNVEVTDIDGTVIPAGYYNGSGSAVLSAAEAAKVVEGNIKDGVTILGVLGTLTGASVLTGNAVVGEVLAGKEFYSNDPDTKLTGTMPDNEGDNVASSSSVSGTTLKLVAPTGFYDGTDTVTITDADFTAGNIKDGVNIFGIDGSYAGGASVLTGDAGVGDVLETKTFYSNDPDTKQTGTMTNRGAVSTDISAKATEVTIAAGYHNGSGVVKIATAEQDKIVTGNIKSGITILGVAGAANVVDTTSGDAVASEILTGKKAWVDGSEVTGSMANNAGNVNAVSYHADGTSIHIVPATGYTDGSDDATVITDADFVSTNIKSGVNIFGVDGDSNVVDTSSGTATATDILNGHKAWVDGSEITGTLGADTYTVAMLHFDGTNNGTTFTDETGKTWTAAGTAVTSTAQKAYGTASGLFDGNSDYISTPDSDDFNFGADPFTIDCWIYPTSLASVHTIFHTGQDVNNRIVFYLSGADLIFYCIAGSSAKAFYTLTGVDVVVNKWQHVAVVRNGTSLVLYVNGTTGTTTETTAVSTNAMVNSTDPGYIGVRKYTGTEDRYFQGYIDEFRISKGIARWTTDFAPGAPYCYHA